MISTIEPTWIRGLFWIGICVGWATTASAELDSIALTEVKGILRSRCLECHRAEASSTDFDVLDVTSLIQSETVTPGNADGSVLMQAITTDDPELRMPQDLPPLPADEIEKIRRWIADGAK